LKEFNCKGITILGKHVSQLLVNQLTFIRTKGPIKLFGAILKLFFNGKSYTAVKFVNITMK